MKKVYITLIALFAFGMTAQAQNISGAISACMDGDTVQIEFDDALNCAAAPGDLAGMTEIGFHSGADQWASVITADAMGAATGVNNGSDVFTVRIHPVSYYALAASPSTIYFVFNQYPTDANAQWDSEGKDDDGAGGCPDFWITMADLAACTTSDTEVELDATAVALAPNPMSGDRTSLFVDAVEVGTYNVIISNTMGQIVRTQNNLSQDVFSIERGNLTAGVYFVTVQGEKGQVSKRLVIQ